MDLLDTYVTVQISSFSFSGYRPDNWFGQIPDIPIFHDITKKILNYKKNEEAGYPSACFHFDELKVCVCKV